MKRLTAALTAALLSTGPVLLADDAERKPEQLFNQLDKDSNGQLAKDEVPENQERFFDRLVRIGDDNEDGELSRKEFIAAMEAPEARAQAQPQEGRRGGPGGGRPQFSEEMFNRLDANGDGKLTKSELPEQAQERMGRLFDRLGKDEVTLDDLKQMQARFGEGGPPQGRRGEGRPGGGEMLARLKQMDANGDGKVTLEEAPEEARERLQRLLDRLGSDAIDLEQMARMAERGGDRPRPEGREGDRPRPEARDGDRPRPEARDGDRPRPEARDGDRPRPGGREGDRPRPEGDRPPRDGDRPRPEGDRPPRDGDRPPFGRPGEGGPRGGFTPAFIRVLDTNEDGALSLGELKGVTSKFDRLDRNGDGKLDRAELMGFGPGGPRGMRDGEGPPRGFGPPRDGDRPRPEGREGDRRRPEGDRPPRDGDRPPRDGDRPPREGDRPPREGDRPPRDGDRPRPERPEQERI